MRAVLALRQQGSGAARLERANLSLPQSLNAPLVYHQPRQAVAFNGAAPWYCGAAGAPSGAPLAAAALQPRRAVRSRALALAPTQAADPRGGAAAGGVLVPSAPGRFCGCGVLGWNTNFSGRFALGPEVGRGSFGVVHQVTHKDTGRLYAVKVLRKCPMGSSGSSSNGSGNSNGSSGPQQQRRQVALTSDSFTGSEGCTADEQANGQHLEAIEREVSAWVSVQGSSYVARLEGLYEDEENAYLVQEMVAGGTIKSLLETRGGKLEEAEAAAVMRGVLDVLFECHQRDIVYGDVKPANFLVASGHPGSEGGVSVRAVDFGCSKQVPLTKPCGSPLYMAPEMAHRRFGTAVDMWAAGVMLHQLLTGRLPFWQNLSLPEVASLPPYAIIAAVRTHDVSYPRATWSKLSKEAQQLVAAMLERNPPDRISATEALAHPWFKKVLGFTPRPSGAEKAQHESPHNNVEFSARIAALHL